MPFKVRDRVVWVLTPGPVFAVRRLDGHMALVESELPWGLTCWVPLSELVAAPQIELAVERQTGNAL